MNTYEVRDVCERCEDVIVILLDSLMAPDNGNIITAIHLAIQSRGWTKYPYPKRGGDTYWYCKKCSEFVALAEKEYARLEASQNAL